MRPGSILMRGESGNNQEATTIAQANATVAGRAKAIYTCVYNEYRSIDLASYGGKIIGYRSTGNLPTANSYINSVGILLLNANGPVDVRTTTGNCTVTIWTYGYVM
jgi:hypothetical protein